MHIVAYTIFVKASAEARARELIDRHLCALFVMHTHEGTWAVCEDRVVPHRPLPEFEYLKKLLSEEPACIVRLCELDAVEHTSEMIRRLVRNVAEESV
ncbi:ORF107 [Lymantria xylina nucleopolyhedrovirus]|uniref:ORF107 n=1 Tax=Lymantria xylina multiple nucleopolyhedrovirus TaxID=2847840 RepID=D4N2E4_9ABAC|nr:ORF107 [Lymantria xylina nucleopolyhedrovirus]ADD73816.1 ORF107 [Lymantria xylina nucleopolyhedrovirus]